MSVLKFFLIAAFPLTALALVDYSSEADSDGRAGVNPKSPGNISVKKMEQPRAATSAHDPFLALSTNYQSIKVQRPNEEGSIGIYNLNAHFDTNANIFSDISYWYGTSNISSLTTTSSMQKGNPVVKLGFNWLNIGDRSDKARIDLYGGVSVKETDSELASSRTDKIAGIMTTKRFDQFAVGLGGELILTGKPKKYGETEIGNITKFGAEAGWVVSQDIRLSLEGSVTRISHADNSGEYTLQKDQSFSTASPKLFLQLFQSAEAELGVVIPTRKANINDDRVFAIRNVSTPGMYGTTLLFGLNFSL
ncbi:MAG: hypothetical protein U0T83_03625 [Bacteriovoracaceae bacterium]